MEGVMRLTRLVAAAACLSLFATLAIPPSPAVSATTSVELTWTAPGDDGMVGRALMYALRYSSAPITSANFDQAMLIPIVVPPQPAGMTETFVVNGLDAHTSYYFALKTMDEAGNWSGISNVLFWSPLAVDVPDLPITLDFAA